MKRPDHDLGDDPTLAGEADVIRRRLNALAWLLDSSIRLPGIGFRIGLDALLGLIPVVGDAVGVLISGYIVREAARLGVPRSTLVRMVANVAIEGLVGMVPSLAMYSTPPGRRTSATHACSTSTLRTPGGPPLRAANSRSCSAPGCWRFYF